MALNTIWKFHTILSHLLSSNKYGYLASTGWVCAQLILDLNFVRKNGTRRQLWRDIGLNNSNQV